jgi:4-hydroxybenzoate polyprenyltransferase
MRSLILLVRVSRPLGWVVAPLVFVIGLYYSGANPSLTSLIQIVLLSFPFSIIFYGINDIYDYDSDKLNPRKTILEFKEENRSLIKRASVFVSICLLASSILTLDLSNVTGMFLLLAVSYLYSAPPVRLKERPPFDSISNGVLFFLAFSLGYSFGGDIWDIPLKIYFVAFCVMGIHSFGTVMDYRVDKKAGQKTLAVVFGKRAASIFSFAAFVSALLFADIGRPYINYGAEVAKV